MTALLPTGWPRPKGYANGVAASGRMVFVAGMIGWDAQGVFHTDDLAGQVRQALQNVVDALREGGVVEGVVQGAVHLVEPVDAELVEQHVRQHLAMHRVADMHRDDMAAVIDDRHAKPFQPHLQNTGMQLLGVAQMLRRF